MRKNNNSSGIYSIRNLINNKIYIGSAINLCNRKSQHFSSLKNNKHYNTHLQKAYNKYKKENFEFEVIEYVTEKFNLLNREQNWITFFKPEYNICKIAGSCVGNILTEEHKKKISESHKGKIVSEETKLKLKNRKISEESKIKLRNFRKGKKLSEETKKKISSSNKNRIQKFSRKVINTKTNKIYETITRASREENIHIMTLRQYLTGKRKNKSNLKLLNK